MTSIGNAQLFPRRCSGCRLVKSYPEFYPVGGNFSSHCKECQGKRYRQDPDKAKSWAVQNKYGLTLEQYNELLEKTSVCGACTRPFGSSRGESPVLDHCHETGKVRGFVHNRCNVGLSRFDDDPDKLYLASVHALKSVDVLSLAERL